jgi:hypothetical protein
VTPSTVGDVALAAVPGAPMIVLAPSSRRGSA